MVFRIAVFVAVFTAPALTLAATVEAGPDDDVEALINDLAPGDELILADGTYTLDQRFSFDIAGTEQEPIVIRAEDGAVPHFMRPDAAQNIWDVNAEWVEFRGLKFSGGSAGLRFESATHVTVADCEISETADVAVRINDTGQLYDGLRIVRNHIHDTGGTGEGMYLGCNENACQLANSVIANNYVHHTNADDVVQGDGIELKEGSYGNVVRDNVIHDTNYPCIITYSAAGNGEANVVERNVLWNCGDHGIQSAADTVLRNNIILGTAGAGIAMQPHQNGTPQNLTVVHNTIVNSGKAIALREAAGTVVLANNAVYSESDDAIFVTGDTSGVEVAGNVGTGGLRGVDQGLSVGSVTDDFVAATFGMAPADVFPAAGGALVVGGDAAYVIAVDFNATPRDGMADVGAYRFSAGGNPGWTIAPEFKGEPPTPAGDAGTADAGLRDAGTQEDVGARPDDGTSDTGDRSEADTGGGDMDDGPVRDGGMDDDSGGCACGTTPHPADMLFGFSVLLGIVWLRRRR